MKLVASKLIGTGTQAGNSALNTAFKLVGRDSDSEGKEKADKTVGHGGFSLKFV